MRIECLMQFVIVYETFMKSVQIILRTISNAQIIKFWVRYFLNLIRPLKEDMNNVLNLFIVTQTDRNTGWLTKYK